MSCFNKRILRVLRLEKGLSQRELALRLGTEVSQISRLESGKTTNGTASRPSIDTVDMLATFFDVPIGVFISKRYSDLSDEELLRICRQIIPQEPKKDVEILFAEVLSRFGFQKNRHQLI